MKKTFLALLILSLVLITGCNRNKDTINIKNLSSFIKNINDIDDVCIVTEDNDTNGQLNKDGGYIDALYFTHSKVDQTFISGNNACEKGTSAGGSIEIYKTVKEAKKRNDYLSNFDGGILADFHKVNKTIVVRISNELTNSQQEELYNKISEHLKDANK